MGVGFLIDMLVSMPQLTESVYFTPPDVLEFIRGEDAAAQNWRAE